MFAFLITLNLIILNLLKLNDSVIVHAFTIVKLSILVLIDNIKPVMYSTIIDKAISIPICIYGPKNQGYFTFNHVILFWITFSTIEGFNGNL